MGLLLIGWLLSACVPATPMPTATAFPTPLAQPRVLVTVYMSPTPNAEQVQATRLASSATPTSAPVSAPPTPTVYVGVFLGEAQNRDDAAALTLAERSLTDAPPPAAVTTNLLAACPAQPDERFVGAWTGNTEIVTPLGCPADQVIPYTGSQQIFERGVMYFNPDGMVWALAPRGADAGEYWFALAASIPTDESPIAPPDGLRVPALGFGTVWRGVPGVRDALGFARTDEQAAQFSLQRMQNGSLLRDEDAGQVFVLVGGTARGTVYGPY